MKNSEGLIDEKRHLCILLHPNILCVAIEDIMESNWAAYIGVVTGRRPKTRWRKIWSSGNMLPQKVAEAVFPGLKHLEWRSQEFTFKERLRIIKQTKRTD